jgi:hypothetical protein|tara:strand:+ start:3482 stop:4156 length:675 start_codon:yes stop_codon:yes gene_type:complete
MTDKKTKTIYEKILSVQEEIGNIAKGDSEGATGLMYDPIVHWEVTRLVKECATKHKLVLLPYVKSHEREGNNTWVTVAIQIVDTESGDNIVIGDYVGQGRDSQDKGSGKATSYAIKTAYLKIFMITTPDDTETETIDSESGQLATTNTMTELLDKYDYHLKTPVECSEFMQNHAEDIANFKADLKSAKSYAKKNKKQIPEQMENAYNRLCEITLQANKSEAQDV